MENYLYYFSIKTYVLGTKMNLFNETVLLKTKNALFNLLIRETSQVLCYERLLNLTYVTYTKNAFFREMQFWSHCYIQWFHIKHYLDYQYSKFQPYTFRVQKMCVFERYATLVPRLLSIEDTKNALIS